ncbi:MAG TPA: trypsin-like peptidase domain-containing protein [Candidatus Limnocylindrales bacterium]
MTDPTRPDAPDSDAHLGTPDDPNDLTRRHDLPATPAPTAAPLTPGLERFSPDAEPRPEWSRHAEPLAPATPERWYEPAPAVATQPAVAPVGTGPGGKRGAGLGTILAASFLSAVLASGGTLVALNASGALDAPVGTPTSSVGATVGSNQPVTIDESSATIDVAAKVSPAVVKIMTSGSANTDFGVIPESGVGSGVIYDANGWILTNRHVVEGSETLQVELSDGRTFTGTVYGIDTLTDLAIVKIDGTDLPSAALGVSDELKVGQLVVAIGSPLGTYSNSVTSGIVSAKGRSITTEDGQTLNNLIQTDAAINPGNSGGPLLDANGSVVGINTAIAADSNGIGFAIPIDIARPIMAQAVAGEKLARPYMGVSYQSITRQLAAAESLPVTDGALIGGGTGDTPAVQPGTPAADAGLQEGDIIVKVDGQAIDGDHPLDATLAKSAPGDTISIEVLRNGQTLTLSLTLGTRPSGL